MKARVFVTLKPSILDPQGKTILSALHALDYGSVEDVRQGKFFEVEIGGASARAHARARGRDGGPPAVEPGDRELPRGSR